MGRGGAGTGGDRRLALGGHEAGAARGLLSTPKVADRMGGKVAFMSLHCDVRIGTDPEEEGERIESSWRLPGAERG